MNGNLTAAKTLDADDIVIVRDPDDIPLELPFQLPFNTLDMVYRCNNRSKQITTMFQKLMNKICNMKMMVSWSYLRYNCT